MLELVKMKATCLSLRAPRSASFMAIEVDKWTGDRVPEDKGVEYLTGGRRPGRSAPRSGLEGMNKGEERNGDARSFGES